MKYRKFAWVVLLALPFQSCSDDDESGPELVQVTGRVNSVDTGSPAKGIRVSLLDTEYTSADPTGDDGVFALWVPKGSELVLYTDDFDPAAGDWFPVINVETPYPVASDHVEYIQIHSCPESACSTGGGSIAIWDRYLASEDDAQGDIFASSSAAESQGIFSFLGQACDDGMPQISPDFSVSIRGTEFPMLYMDGDATFAAALACDSLDVGLPPETDRTDWSGWAVSFGEPSFSGNTIFVDVVDHDPERNFQGEDIAVPVRPGTISLFWWVTMDGENSRSVTELIQTCYGG